MTKKATIKSSSGYRTFEEFLQGEKIHDSAIIKGLLFGSEIEIVNLSGSHNYGPIGTIITLNRLFSLSTGSRSLSGGIPGGNSLVFTNFKLVVVPNSKEALERDIAKATEDIAKATEMLNLSKQKLSFFIDNKLNIFDKKSFKVFQGSQIIKDTSLSDTEKVNQILKLGALI